MLYLLKTVFDRIAGIFLFVALVVCCVSVGGSTATADTGTIVASRLNVRSAPSTDASKMTSLNKGTQVTVLDYVDGWLKISYNGGEGYIRNLKNYVHVTGTTRDLSQLREKAKQINQKIESHRTDLKEYSRRGTELLEDLNTLDLSLHDIRTQVDRLQIKINALRQEIETTRQNIAAIEKRIAKNRSYAAKRLVALYKLNLIGKMNVLGTADSVYEFLKTKRDVGFICDYDESVLTSYLTDRARLETLITHLDAEQQEKVSLEETFQEKIRAMNREKGKRRQFLADIRKKASLRKAALKSLQAASKKLDQTIASLYVEPSRPENNLRGEFSARKGLLKMPVAGKIINKFGKYKNRELKVENFRSGIDISAVQGDPVRSVYRGQVLYSNWFKGYGNMIIIDHGDHYYTVYAHIQDMLKKKGDMVDIGEVIGTVGETASMTGSTLYFEIRHKGTPVDPLPWLARG